MSPTALLVVDVQNDFTEHGRLAVAGGDATAAAIGSHVAAHRGSYALVVGTGDWHIDPGRHFSDEPDFVDTWPVHCVAGSDGARFDDQLAIGAGVERPEDVFDVVAYKGERASGYSAFEAVDTDGRPFIDVLVDAHIDEIVIAGIATSHCVRTTALDGLAAGFQVRVLADLCVGVTEQAATAALAELAAAGVAVVRSSDPVR